MAFTGAKADRESVTIPPKLRPDPNATLMVEFRAGAADADGDGYLNPQELRNLASRLAKMETEDELRAALSGVLSGRLLEGFFKYREEALQKAAKEERKARDDLFYMALLQAQLDDLNRQIGDLGERISALQEARQDLANGTPLEDLLKRERVQQAIKEWEIRNKRKFDPSAPDAKTALDTIMADQIKVDTINADDLQKKVDNITPILKNSQNATNAETQVILNTDTNVVYKAIGNLNEHEKSEIGLAFLSKNEATELDNLTTSISIKNDATPERNGTSFAFSSFDANTLTNEDLSSEFNAKVNETTVSNAKPIIMETKLTQEIKPVS